MKHPGASGNGPERVRLAKHLAHLGVASRRAAEKMVFAGRVAVDGAVVRDPALGVNDLNEIRLDGVPVAAPAGRPVYVMFHKPVGVLVTMSPSRESGSALTDFISSPERLHPVGRLDRDSSGLLLLTNDGGLTHLLTHPRHRIIKEYLLKLNRTLTEADARRLERGVEIDSRVVEVDALRNAPGGRIAVGIHEGRKRILRRLFGELGCRVLELKRIRIGPVVLGKLPVGKWRRLSEAEVTALQSAAWREDSQSDC